MLDVLYFPEPRVFDKMLQSFIELLGLVLAHGLGLGLFSEIIPNK